MPDDTKQNRHPLLEEMNARSREVFRRIVESYLESGEPVGSRSLTRSLSESISAATIRNVMQDLEHMGLLNSPHISAGRIPTEIGLRMFVDGFMEIDEPSISDRDKLSEHMGMKSAANISAMLDDIGSALSGVTGSASLVLAPKHEAILKHVDLVGLGPDRALVVLVFEDGHVENRIFSPPPGQTPSSMREAANFINAIAGGKRLSEMKQVIKQEIENRRQEIDGLASTLVESGLALWENKNEDAERLIVRGRSNLLSDTENEEDLERIRELFDDLERKRDIAEFLDLTEEAEGVRIFIGSENRLFSLSGSSLVVSPYMNADRKVIGAVGVIGPKRLNYGRIVPIVDYTAQLLGRIISGVGSSG